MSAHDFCPFTFEFFLCCASKCLCSVCAIIFALCKHLVLCSVVCQHDNYARSGLRWQMKRQKKKKENINRYGADVVNTNA